MRCASAEANVCTGYGGLRFDMFIFLGKWRKIKVNAAAVANKSDANKNRIGAGLYICSNFSSPTVSCTKKRTDNESIIIVEIKVNKKSERRTYAI